MGKPPVTPDARPSNLTLPSQSRSRSSNEYVKDSGKRAKISEPHERDEAAPPDFHDVSAPEFSPPPPLP